jgi:hypothetical protein
MPNERLQSVIEFFKTPNGQRLGLVLIGVTIGLSLASCAS